MRLTTVDFVPRLLARTHRDLGILAERLSDVILGIRTFSPSSAELDKGTWNPAYKGYGPTSYAALAIIRDKLQLGPDDIFYDIGCGLGRVLCYFSLEPILRCVGVELRTNLAKVALANAKKSRGRKAKIEVRVGDATEQDFAGGTVFFMFDPFDADTMTSVLQRIDLHRRGLPIRIVYVYPAARKAVDSCDWLKLKEEFAVPHTGLMLPVCIWESGTRCAEHQPGGAAGKDASCH